MNRSLKILSFSLVSAVAQLASAQDLSASDIVDKALDTNTVGFQSGEVTMSLYIASESGEQRERHLQIRGLEESGATRSLVRVTAPADLAGQTYLFLENPQGEDDIYVYLPALDDAPRRISGSQKDGAFMGSHFTFSDLESRDVRGAAYTRVADENIGGFDVYVVEATPAPGEESDYSKVVLWIRKADFIPLRVRYFDAAGAEAKTIFTEETAVDGARTYVKRLTLRTASGAATTMYIDSASFNVAVSPTEMTPENMVN